MKYLTLGVCLLAVLFLFSCVNANCTAQALDDVTLPLAQAMEALEQGNEVEARRYADHAAAAWTQALPRLERLLHHAEVDAISQGFAQVALIPPEELPALCAELHAQLDHLRSMDRLSLENLL